MDPRLNSPSYSSLFAILLIIAIMLVGANIGLQTLVNNKNSGHTLRIEGQTSLREDVSRDAAAAFIEHTLNTTEPDRQIIETIQKRLEN